MSEVVGHAYHDRRIFHVAWNQPGKHSVLLSHYSLKKQSRRQASFACLVCGVEQAHCSTERCLGFCKHWNNHEML